MQYPIYLDYAATTPVDERVLQEILPYFSTHFGNAASRYHAFGWKAEEAVKTARQQVADLLGASEKEIVFTSGATESINLAIKGVFEANKHKGNHIITVSTEHKAVLDTCHHLEKLGAEITYLEVDSKGNLDLQKLEKAITSTTILVSTMAANNEIGVLHPIKKIATICKQKNILFHTDATQAVGKIAFDVEDWNIDLLSFSGHKIYAPKGVGVLYARKKTPIVAQQDGGQHERNMRSGTLNVIGIVGIGKACEIAQQEMLSDARRLRELRDKLENGILSQIADCQVNGDTENRLPNITNIAFGGVDGEDLLMSLNKIAVSNGSACNSASTEPSYVLKALNLDDNLAYSSVRFSLGKYTTEQDIDIAIKHVVEVMNKCRM